MKVSATTDGPMRRRDLVVLFVAALAIRAVYLWQLRGYDFAEILILDPRAYDSEARRILAGGSFPEPFYQAPFYAYFLAGIYAVFGHSFAAVRIIQVVLGSVAVVLTADLGGRLFGRGAGLVAGVLSLLYGVFPLYEGQIMKTSVSILFAVLLLWLLEPARRVALGVARSALAGVVLGLSILSRENLLLFLPAGAFVIYRGAARSDGRGGAARGAAAFCAATLATLVPALVHNVRAGHEWILVTSQGGQNFYIGNHHAATGTYCNPPFVRPDPLYERLDFHSEAERRAGRTLSATEASDFWYLESMKQVIAEPGRAFRLLGKKALLVFNGIELPDNESLYAMRDSLPILKLLPLSFAVLVPLAMLEAILARKRAGELLFLHLFVAVNFAALALFFVVSRYRVTIAPVLIVLAGAALVRLGAWARAARPRPLAASAAFLVAAMAPLSVPDLAGFDPRDYRSINHFLNAGEMYASTGRLDEAIISYRSAIAFADTIAMLHMKLGKTLFAAGRFGEAHGAFERAVALQPESPDARNGLGIVLGQAGETARAEQEFLAANRMFPTWAAPLENLAYLYEITGDSLRRANTLAALARLRPARAGESRK